MNAGAAMAARNWTQILAHLMQVAIVATLGIVLKTQLDVAEIKRDHVRYDDSLEHLEADAMEAKRRLRELEAFAAKGDRFTATQAAEMKAELKEWTIQWLRGDLAEIKSDLSNLKTDMQAVRTDIATIKAQSKDN